jgi:N-acetylmuramoyl-L-alanine amidase
MVIHLKKMIMKHIIYQICIFILWPVGFLYAQNMSDLTIYINPGHGGFDSDDRNVVIAPYSQGEPNGFWESQSNLDKGLQLREMLEACGAKVFMSRTTNTTDDDLALSRIVRLANESNADFMLAIHSNAGGTANMVLQLYSGVDPDDTHTYTTPTKYSKEGLEICTINCKKPLLK